ncbi:MAG: hypothetical protein DI628_01240 [Blastochloris viridis]|uniref:Uncharacterized protein n=1 Tax=Blastochloris viridis TaxID=1079 RepID=A0A6N4R281_BLAVI|nr:MAG: hypothetical protein DI628_01240 [Blastochloris viridis]
MSKKLIVPISDIRVTAKVDLDVFIPTFANWHPDAKDLLETLTIFDPADYAEHGSGNWDERQKHKSLCVVSQHDRPPNEWRYDAVFAELRPVMTFYDAKDGHGPVGVLHLREFIVDGAKGHAHAPYGPDNRMEDVIFTVGGFDEMTDEEYRLRHHIMAHPRFTTVDA